MNASGAALRIADYLSHMIEAVQLALGYTETLSKADFLQDRRTQQAVILNLITIGEVAARMVNEHKDFAAEHPDIPWAQMRGMRNRMTHGYFQIAIDIVWETVQTSLPELERQLQAVHSQLD